VSDGDRHSVAEIQAIITDPDELARREVENGIRQFNVAMQLVKTHVNDVERPFKLRSSHVLMLNHEALRGIHPQAGTYRNTKVQISKSRHQPPEHYFVAEEVEAMCGYVNSHLTAEDASPLHLAAYLLWKLNWIHPFADGNGRSSRVVSYVVLSIRLNSVLPGVPTIPDQIAGNKQPYYEALEKADDAWAATGAVDVSEMEKIVDAALAQQLVSAVNEAAGH
jgi:Fic family protein